MKKVKILALIMALMMIVVSFAACADTKTNEENTAGMWDIRFRQIWA